MERAMAHDDTRHIATCLLQRMRDDGQLGRAAICPANIVDQFVSIESFGVVVHRAVLVSVICRLLRPAEQCGSC